MRFLKSALVVAVALAAGGCQNPQGASSLHANQGNGAEANAQVLSRVDWKKPNILRIELRDYGFIPRELRLRVGQPYRLEIFNSGGNTHYLNAPEFFNSIATRKAEVPHQAEIRAERFTQFEVMRRGGELHFYFVPLVAGTYRMHCHLENHAERGVEGTIIVE